MGQNYPTCMTSFIDDPLGTSLSGLIKNSNTECFTDLGKLNFPMDKQSKSVTHSVGQRSDLKHISAQLYD